MSSPDQSNSFAVGAAGLGDVDGDGAPDFAVVDWTAAPFTPVDEVLVFSGRTGALVRVLQGLENDDDFGAGLAALGDVDGDGVPDLAVGSPGEDTNANASGRVDVISGADGSTIRTLFGTGHLHVFGRTVANPGDVSGDGVDDLLVTAAGENIPPAWGGIVRLFDGASGAQLDLYSNGATTSDLAEGYGDSLAGAGDLDGDGVRDVLVGAPFRLGTDATGEFARFGAVEARSGADGSLLFQLDDLGSDLGSNQAYGRAVAGGTDLDGDGVGEVLVGVTGDDTNGPNAGALYVYDGATRALLAKHLGDPQGSGSFGYHCGFVGDVNGDGTADYAAAYDYSGTIGYSGYVRIYSGVDHQLLDQLGGAGVDCFGSAFAPVGDVDGDLLPDLVVGARCAREARVMSVAGARVYGEVPAEATQSLDLVWTPSGGPDPARGTLEATGGPPGAPALFACAFAPAMGDFFGATLLIDLADPGLALEPVALDGLGEYRSIETTLRQPALDGVGVYCQLLALDLGSPLGFVTSAGLDLRLTD